jgi:hypothetical protein
MDAKLNELLEKATILGTEIEDTKKVRIDAPSAFVSYGILSYRELYLFIRFA